MSPGFEGCCGCPAGISRLCEEIDERVDALLTRPIEGAWPYLWIDATYLKDRQGGRIVSVAVGVNTDGRRKVLSMAILTPFGARCFFDPWDVIGCVHVSGLIQRREKTITSTTALAFITHIRLLTRRIAGYYQS